MALSTGRGGTTSDLVQKNETAAEVRIMTSYVEEEECRVCRDTSHENEPLVSPCVCDGSIRFVHEACLVKWLDIKKSETCELCGHRFEFTAIYRDGAPEVLPCSEILQAFCGMVISRYKAFAKFIYCIILWAALLPILIKWSFMAWEQENHTLESILSRMTLTFIWEDLQHGLFLMATTIVVVLALVAFTDFYRWRTEDQVAIDRAMQNDEQNFNEFFANEVHNDSDDEDVEDENIDGAGGDDNGGDAANDNLNGDQEERQEGQPIGAAQEQQQGQQQQRNNNNLNNENVDFIDDGGGEMQLPLNALLGFDSHPIAAVRNMVLFWLFVSLVLVIFVAFPRGVGRGLLSSIFSSSSLKSIMIGPVFTNTVHFFVGHTIIIGALVGLPYFTAQWASRNLSSELASNIVSYLSAVASVLKITVLFIFKMGIYPICLGLVWHASELDCFKEKIIHEWVLMENYPVTAGVAMHWVLGIGFMLIVTVVILELKDVLHPEVLNVGKHLNDPLYFCYKWKLTNYCIYIFIYFWQGIVRIPKPEQNLLETLLEDSWGTHMRRSIVSSVIYILLIILFLILPVEIAQHCPLPFIRNIVPFRPPCAYFWVNGQILLEVTAVYLVVYYAIEPFRAALRQSMDHSLPKVCKILGLETYLLPIKTEVLVALENGEDLIKALNVRSSDASSKILLGPRKLCPRRTPSYVVIRLSILIALIWFTVLFINIAILCCLGVGIYLPFFAFRLEAGNGHGPYGLVGTVLVGWLVKHRLNIFMNLHNRIQALPSRIFLYVIQPIFLTSLLSNIFNSTAMTYDYYERSNLLRVIYSNYYFSFGFVLLLVLSPIMYKKNRNIMPSWYFFYMVLPFCFCVLANLFIGGGQIPGDINTVTHTQNQRQNNSFHDALIILIKDYVGGVWSTIFLICMYDIVMVQVLPVVSSFHRVLRDEKYLIGKKLQNYEKAQLN